MSLFEFLVTLYSIVTGLGLTLSVRSLGQMLESRRKTRLYWVHTCWLAIMLVSYVMVWFQLWSYRHVASWTLLEGLLMLSVPVALYLVSHLAVPELGDGSVHDMRAYYYDPPSSAAGPARARGGAVHGGRDPDPRPLVAGAMANGAPRGACGARAGDRLAATTGARGAGRAAPDAPGLRGDGVAPPDQRVSTARRQSRIPVPGRATRRTARTARSSPPASPRRRKPRSRPSDPGSHTGTR